MAGVVIQGNIQDIRTKLDMVEGKIREAYADDISNSDAVIQQEVDLQKIKKDIQIYNAKFEEEKFPYQRSAPKKRRQTLQEFVLLFFYISFLIFSIAVTIFAFLHYGQSYTAAFNALILCIVVGLAITAILMRVA